MYSTEIYFDLNLNYIEAFFFAMLVQVWKFHIGTNWTATSARIRTNTYTSFLLLNWLPLNCRCFVSKSFPEFQLRSYLSVTYWTDRCGRYVVEASWNVTAHAQKPDFVFRRNGRVHLNRRGALVQSTTGSRVVRISRSNARYTVFRGSVKGTGYQLHSPVSPSVPLPCVTACHHISTGVYVPSNIFLNSAPFSDPCSVLTSPTHTSANWRWE